VKILKCRTWFIIASGLPLILFVVLELCLMPGGGIPGFVSKAQTSISICNRTDCTNNTTNNNTVYSSGISAFSSAITLEPLNPNDPYSDQQWALNRIQALELRQIATKNDSIIVAILDTGIDKYHEDLIGTVITEINFTETNTPHDVNGHGTHVAGIIAAISDNGKGIVGIAPGVRLMNVKVADDKGLCNALDIARGIIWAVDNGAKVINISLEVAESSEVLEDAVEYAWKHGVLVVTAAGNDGNDVPVYPAGYDNTLAVAALTMEDYLAPLSNYGDWVDVSAPGLNIFSTLPANKYGYKTGTSFAAAYVSGVAAMLFNIASDTNGNGQVNDEVRAAIETGCQEIGISDCGKGRLDAAGAITQINGINRILSSY
jgi:thermitase